MLYKFHEVLNDLTNYLILGDICLLKSWQNKNGLKDDLASEFTTNGSGDKPELLKEENRLQVRQGGYSLKVENNVIMLFTWPVSC